MTVNKSHVLQILKTRIVPPLSKSFHKGEAGRIAVIGGSEEYTGAPFYASESSLKGGCDLSFVICTKSASIPIKSYSPEIIVYPYIHESSSMTDDKDDNSNDKNAIQSSVRKIEQLFPRLHALVMGPGLGRNKSVLQVVSHIITIAREKEMPIVIDGDGLYLVSQQLDLIKGYKHAVLLPNPVEYKRLYEAVFKHEDSKGDEKDEEQRGKLERLCNELGNVTIVRKGSVDMISNGSQTLICDEKGSLRRSGGQGDILSGLTGTFVHWAHWAKKRYENDKDFSHEKIEDLILYSCYGACMLTRKCAEYAFRKNFRSTTAPDLLSQLPFVLQDTFPCHFEE